MKPKKGAALPKGRQEMQYECLKSDNLRLPEDGGKQERMNADRLANFVKKKANPHSKDY